MEKIILVETAQRLLLGQQGEHLARAITFDFTSWKNQYGEGSIQLQVQRPGTDDPYPVPLQIDDTLATWNIEQRDTVEAGEGKLQLLYIVSGEIMAKSHIFITSIKASLSQPGSVSPVEQAFLDKVVQAAGEAEKAVQDVKKAAQQVAQDASQTTTACTEAKHAKEQANQAATAAAKDKIAAEGAAKNAVQAVSDFDRHVTEQIERMTVLGNQIENSIAQDKADVQIAAAQTSRDANTVNAMASVIAQQVKITQKAATDAADAANRSAADAERIEETMANYNVGIIEQLCTPFSITDSLITCNPVLRHPLHVVSHIEPVQEGEGIPRPDNVRTIKGWTGVKLIRGGKNLLKITATTQTVNGVTFTVNPDKSITVNGTPTSGSASIKIVIDEMIFGGKTVVLSANNPNQQYGKWWVEVITKQADGSNGHHTLINDVVINTDVALQYIVITVKNGTSVQNQTIKLQAEVGSVATSYAPYQSDEYMAQFGQTVYGGTYDWNKGELIITYVGVTMNGSEDWILEDGTFRSPSTLKYTGKTGSKGFSNISKYIYSFIEGGIFAFRKQLIVGKAMAAQYKTVDAWKTQLDKTNLHVIYEIDAPLHIKLSSKQIFGMLGTNTMYSDTGDTKVEGHIDPVYEKQQLKDMIVALGPIIK